MIFNDFQDIVDSGRKYNIIYADPPWQYRDKANAGERGAVHKYQVQDLNWIKSLPVKEIAADTCVLFLWITMPQLEQCPWTVMNNWGFTYKTAAFTWVKRNKVADSWFWGMGNWTRSNPELCLMGVKGKPKRASASVHSVCDARVRKHSQKPDEVRENIVKLCGDLPRIELFARESVNGWDAWGNEV